MSLRAVRQMIETKPTIEGAGVKLRRAFGFKACNEFKSRRVDANMFHDRLLQIQLFHIDDSVEQDTGCDIDVGCRDSLTRRMTDATVAATDE